MTNNWLVLLLCLQLYMEPILAMAFIIRISKYDMIKMLHFLYFNRSHHFVEFKLAVRRFEYKNVSKDWPTQPCNSFITQIYANQLIMQVIFFPHNVTLNPKP